MIERTCSEGPKALVWQPGIDLRPTSMQTTALRLWAGVPRDEYCGRRSPRTSHFFRNAVGSPFQSFTLNFCIVYYKAYEPFYSYI